MAVNSLILSWTASSSGSPPIRYQPQFRVQGATTWINFGSTIAVLSVTVTGLSAATSYEFDVIASNTAGTATSAIATGATSSTAGTAPSVPGNLVVSP